MPHIFRRLTTCLLSLIAMLACESNSIVNPVPNYPVSMELNILAEYPNFVTSNIGASLTFTAPRYPNERVGYAGLLLFVNFNEQYSAFDLCCPNCVDRFTPIQVDGFYAECPLCGERYDLTYGLGVPTKHIAENYLKTYKTNYNNYNGKLIIYN